MTRPSIAVAGSLLLAGLLTAPALPQSSLPARSSYPIPKTLTLNHATLPIWIDASVAVTANGEPNPAIWGEYTGRITELLQKTASGGCREVGPVFEETPMPPPRATLDDAVTHSDVALLGRVTDKAYGFYSGAPGQLIQVEPERSFGRRLDKARYYFFVPVARFQIGSVELCKTDPRYAEPPDVGGEVFLFVLPPADPTGTLLHVLNPGDIVPVGAGGDLRLPAQYAGGQEKSAAAQTKAGLLAAIEAKRGKGVQP
ncbi:MAG: hypothetical protein ACJ76Y_16865 [Thermoanaerobaculia bacterium]